ncbi:hypothetical protein YC2023_119910 [Brassica napus]
MLLDPIPETEQKTVFLDAGKAPGRRRRVLLPVSCFSLLWSYLFVAFGYGFRLLAVSYGSRPMFLEAPHTRSVRLLVRVESTLGSQTNPPLLTTAIVLPSSILGAAPPCGNTTTRSTHPGLGLAGSRGLCRSKALSPFLATFTFNETPPYCIETLSFWSPNSSTIPISNRCLSPTLVYCLAGLGPVVYPVFVTASAHQRLNGDNISRENLLKSPAKQMLFPSLLPQRPYPEVYKRHLSTGFLSPTRRREAETFSENGIGESLKHKTLICTLLGNSWAWAWLHQLGHIYILRGSGALRFYVIFISKFKHLGSYLLLVLLEIHIVSSESFLGGSNCRHLKPQFHGSIRQLPPTLQAIMLDSVLNSSMESEIKRVSTDLSFRLPICLLLGTFEIHLVSRDIVDGIRAGLFRLTGNLVSIGFPLLFQPLSLGYFNVFSDYLKLFRAVVSRIQVKIIRGSLYFELASLCNTSIPCFTALLSFFFTLPSSIPPVVIAETF